MRDNDSADLKALPNIIDSLKIKGYTILPLFYESTVVNKKDMFEASIFL